MVRHAWFVVVLIAASLGGGTLGHARQPPRPMAVGTGTITGVVVDAASGRSIGGAQVGLAGVASGSDGSVARMAITDEEGRFSFERVPAGQLRLGVTRDGYLTGSYGQARAGVLAAAFSFGDGQQFDVRIEMFHGGVLAGRVFDSDGRPSPNVNVRAMKASWVSGSPHMMAVGQPSRTDDRGAYRLFTLAPGDYVVSATPPATSMPVGRGPAMTYLPTYFPSAAAIGSAQHVAVEEGKEKNGLDIRVAHILPSEISGTIAGAIPAGLSVRVQAWNDDELSVTSQPITDVRAADGTFTLHNLVPGQYTVIAQTVQVVPPPQPGPAGVPRAPDGPPTASLPDSLRLWARATVTVDGRSNPVVTLVLQRGRSISGHVVFDRSTTPDPSFGPPTLLLQVVSSDQPSNFGPVPIANIGSNGDFRFTGVPPGRYRVRFSGYGVLRSVLIDGRDVLDFPLTMTGAEDITSAEVTVTDRVNRVTGRVVQGSGTPGNGYTILLATTDRNYWVPGSRRILLARSDADGRYVFQNMQPGEYFIMAVDDLELGRQFDPDYLKVLIGKAARITVGDGVTLTRDLQVGGR